MRKMWVVMMLCGSIASAAEPTLSAETKRALDQLQVKLDHAAQRANQPTAGRSHVVGLRGAKQTSAKQLYWKEASPPPTASPEEVKALRDALALAQTGDRSKAVTALTDFKTKYTQSALRPDADEALKLLQPAP